MKYFIPLNFHLLLKPKKKKKLSLRILHHKNFIIIMHPTSPTIIFQTLDKIWNLALEVHNTLISVLFSNKIIYNYVGKMLFTTSITPTSFPFVHLSYGFLVLCVDLFLLFQVFCRGGNSPPWTANQCFFQTVFCRCSVWPSSILLLC